METTAVLESPALALKDALEEANKLMVKIRTHLQNTVMVVFKSELEQAVHQCIKKEDTLFTTWTKQRVMTLASAAWSQLDRDKLLTQWNKTLPRDIPQHVSWWCLTITVWKWTRTKTFHDQVVGDVSDRIMLGCYQGQKSVLETWV